MTLSQEQLEWIVAEVIRRLKMEVSAAPASSTSLTIDDRLVTLATLEGRLNGVQSVRVPKAAVLTPAARDEFRQRGIELVRS